jgi:hypothetical protein
MKYQSKEAGNMEVKVGGVYKVEDRYKNPDGEIITERFCIEVTGIEDREDYQYVSFRMPAFRDSRFGTFKIYPEGKEKPFGKKIIGEF